MMLFLLKFILGIIVFRYVLLRYTVRFFRAKWLSKWDKNDVIYIFNTHFFLRFIDDSTTPAHLYKCRVLKWDISECEVIVDDADGDPSIGSGAQMYFPMNKVVKNESCKQRTRQSKMDNFMLNHSSKAEERNKKLEDLLKG